MFLTRTRVSCFPLITAVNCGRNFSGKFFSRNLSHEPCLERFKWYCMGNSSKKKRWCSIFLFFFIFIQVQVEKSLSLPGKKIKMFILIDMAKNRKKRFLDLFSWILLKKNLFFFKTYFLGKLDMFTKNFNFRIHIGSKTPKLGIFTHEFFVGIHLLEDFS